MPAFVTGRPHDDTAMVFVPADCPLHSFHVLLVPYRVRPRPVPTLDIEMGAYIGIAAQESVGLNIRFKNHIKP